MKLKDACSLEKSCDQSRQHVIKQRHYFAYKGPYSQSYDFSSSYVWMWKLDRRKVSEWVSEWKLLSCVQLCATPQTAKRAEGRRINAFKLWCWRKLLRVPWTARRSNQSILKKINPEYSLEGLMLKLKLQYFGHLMQRADSWEKTLMLGRLKAREEGDRGLDGRMASLTQWTWV